MKDLRSLVDYTTTFCEVDPKEFGKKLRFEDDNAFDMYGDGHMLIDDSGAGVDPKSRDDYENFDFMQGVQVKKNMLAHDRYLQQATDG